MNAPKKSLLAVTAIIEAGAGVALMIVPSAAVMLLLGAPLDMQAGPIIARIAGAALLALGVACWIARKDAQSHAAAGLTAAMSLYNSATVVILSVAGIGYGPRGALLWPAVILHAAMAIWCAAYVRK